MWIITDQSKVQELNDAMNEMLIYSQERRPGRVSGVGVRTWEGMKERIEEMLELLCETVVWKGKSG